MLNALADALASIALGLRDGLRPGLLLSSLGWLMAVLVAWFVLFSVVDERWWSLATLTAHVQARTGLDSAFAGILATLLFTFSYVLLVVASMALVILFVLMPRIRAVCLKAYPGLADAAGGMGLIAPLRNALWLLAAVVLAALLSWLLPVLGVALGLALVSYFNARGLLYDALDGLATTAEQEVVLRRQRGAILLLGLALSALAMVPLLGLLGPVIMGTSASHLAFRSLARQRGIR